MSLQQAQSTLVSWTSLRLSEPFLADLVDSLSAHAQLSIQPDTEGDP